MSKPKKLRDLLGRDGCNVLMEAHNGLSAKLAQEAGFEALWGSGLAISAALGVRDNNEASWTQVLEVLEFMNDACELPILMDGDTGYGNFNNVRRLVTKLEQRGIAGVCLEDKLFPKMNSFVDGEQQALAEVDEFCGKVRAAKETQRDPDFVVVARTEAFIAGWGLREALVRATAYAESGADAILVHSKRSDADEILRFKDAWRLDVPIVIVPTKYPAEPLARFVERGIHHFIFANQSLRAVITGLQATLRKLRETSDLMSVEKDIAPVDEVFRLQDLQELKQSEKRYLPARSRPRYKALVLGATKGDFGALVENKPKCMLVLRGRPLLSWHVDAFGRQGIRDVAVVRGYRKDAVDLAGLTTFDNDQYARTGELWSLYAAREFLTGNVVVAYGDVLFDDFILRALLAEEAPIVIAADAAWALRERQDVRRDLVSTEGMCTPLGEKSCRLMEMGNDLAPDRVTGEFIGLVALRARGTEMVVDVLDCMAREEPERLRNGQLGHLFERLRARGQAPAVVHTFGHWRDLDCATDLIDTDHAS